MASIRLGRIAGFRFGVDYSWFIIFFLILWSFTAGVFPAQAPGLGAAGYLVMGLAGTLLFFVSLVLHELAHAVIARRRGIEVESITLFLLGGVARTRAEPMTPGDEFRIAAVGPLMSLLIATALLGLAILGRSIGWHVSIVVVLEYIALLNFVLAAFNLLPGFPLDGGRVLRAAVWHFTGDATKATRVAAGSGRLMAWVLFALGAFEIFGGAVLGGVWLILIGWFIRNAADAGYQQHMLRSTLGSVLARNTMTPAPRTIGPDLTLERLVGEYFMHTRYLSFPVVQDDRPLGIITLNQVKAVPRDDWPQRTVADTMTKLDEGIVVSGADSLLTVMERLQASPVRRLLVVENGVLIGFITAHDVAAWIEKSGVLKGDRKRG
ncbi:MAG: site-2 protease family protein [Longimicrobiales bacterium]